MGVGGRPSISLPLTSPKFGHSFFLNWHSYILTQDALGKNNTRASIYSLKNGFVLLNNQMRKKHPKSLRNLEIFVSNNCKLKLYKICFLTYVPFTVKTINEFLKIKADKTYLIDIYNGL